MEPRLNTQNFYNIIQTFQTMTQYQQESARVCIIIIIYTHLAIKASKHCDNCTLGNFPNSLPSFTLPYPVSRPSTLLPFP